MSELLFEILSEEIPARMQLAARQQLQDMAIKELTKAEIKFGKLEAFVSMRRLVLLVQDLALNEAEDEFIYKKGPAVDEPEELVDSFAAACSVSRTDLIIKEIKSKQYYFARQAKPKPSLKHLLKHILERLMQEFSWPKSMRWDESNVTWVRPIRNILCLHDGQVLPIQYGNLVANDLSFGHRFLHSASFKVKNFHDYADKLEKAKVMLSYEARKTVIEAQITSILAPLGARTIADEELIDEVCGLVEDPHALVGRMDSDFLSLPDSVLITAMRKHQKYFAMQNESGKLLPNFVVVSNIPSHDETIIKGNQRVLTARLADAKFLFEEDRKFKLASYVDKLDKIVFHEALDTMLDKTLRLVQLGPKLAASYTGSVNLEIVKRAATLAKADLATNLVKEFPELQGTIGQCYAGLDGEPEAVAKAIYEHYLPKGKDDAMPQSIESALIALADKFDNLVGLYFACGAPTSSKDPYALRRQALGIVKLLCAFDISVDVNDIIETCLDLIGAVYHELLVSRIAKFLYDRFKIYLKDNFRPDLIDAVLRVSSDNVAFDYKKLQCLDKFLATQEGLNTFRSIKRVLNIITKDSTQTTVNIKLMNAHDKHLYAKVKGITASNNTVQIHSLADLSKTIDDFFDKVLIMDENLDVRSNRLALLKLASAAFLDFADFSCIKI